MANNPKLRPINNEIDPKILEDWKKSIDGTETKRKRLEESLLDNIEKHRKTTE